MTAPDQPAAITVSGDKATAPDRPPASPAATGSNLRDRVAEALRQAFHHWITAEWICCEPLAKGHKLCKKGHTTRRMVRALLADDPEEWSPKSPIIDAAMAEVQPVLDAKDAEIAQRKGDVTMLSDRVTELEGDSDYWRQRAEDAEIKRLHVEVSRFRRAWEDAMADGDQQAVQRLSLRNQLNQERQRAEAAEAERRDWQMAAQTAENELARLREQHQQIGDLP